MPLYSIFQAIILNKIIIRWFIGNWNNPTEYKTKNIGQGEENTGEFKDYQFGDALEKIDMTQSIKNAQIRTLGHDFVTLQRFDEMVIPLNTNSTIKILVATDGLYDMLYEEEPLRVYSNYTAKDYTSLAKKRWMQQWNLYDDNLKVLTPVTFQSDMDDVGVIVYEMNM